MARSHVLLLIFLGLPAMAIADGITVATYVQPFEQNLDLAVIDEKGLEKRFEVIADDRGGGQAEVELVTQPDSQAFAVFNIEVRKQDKPGVLESLQVEAPAIFPGDRTSLWIFCQRPPAGAGTIKTFATRGLKGTKAFETYYEARFLFNDVKARSATHPLIVGSAYWYFSASYELARRKNSIVPMDEDGIQAAEYILEVKAKDQIIANAFAQYDVKPEHLRKMIEKARDLKFGRYSLVRDLTKKHHFAPARSVANFFQTAYLALPFTHRQRVAAEHKVNLQRFENDLDYLAAREVYSQRTVD